MDFYTVGTRGFCLACGRGASFCRSQAEDTSGETFRAGHFLRQDRNRKPRMIASGTQGRISTELTLENQFYKAKMKIFKKCIPSACESVYREIFVPHRETVRLSSKPWDLRGLDGRAVNWLQSCSARDVEWKRNAEVSNMPNFRVKHSLLLTPKCVKSGAHGSW